MDYWEFIKYFKPHEFDSPDHKGSGQKFMNERFVRALDGLREHLNFPIVVTSGYRTESHNKAVGGAPSSDHLTGKGVDIKVNSRIMANRIIANAHSFGLNAIGDGYDKYGFLHLGMRDKEAFWTYN